jgi:N-acetylneuraminic acid mutarotase
MPWYTKASLPAARYWATGYAISGTGYFLGGNDGSGAVRQNYAYNPASNTWSTKAQLPAARYGLAGFSILGIGYAVGGHGSTGPASNLYAYDPAANSWSTKTSMPGGTRYALAGFAISDIGYAIGGISGTNTTLERNESYNPSSNAWTTRASMPTARNRLCAFVINGIGYAVGGLDASGNTLATNEAYDPVTDTWSTKASKPTAVAGACAFVLSNLGYVISQTVNEAYDPVIDTWFTKESPPSATARNYAAAFVISGTGYMAGGIIGSTVSSAVEAFVPSVIQDATVQARGSSVFSLQVQRGRDASTVFSSRSDFWLQMQRGRDTLAEFIGRSVSSAILQRIFDATMFANGGTSCSASVRDISAIATQVTGSSAVSAQTVAPIDISARSVGSSICSAFPQYSATFMVNVTAGSSCLVNISRAGTIGPAIITGAATVSLPLSLAFGVRGESTGSSICSAYTSYDCITGALASGQAKCSAHLQRDRAIATLVRGATDAILSGTIACQVKALANNFSAFSASSQSTSIIWAQFSGDTVCATGIQLVCKVMVLSIGESTWAADVRRASTGHAEARTSSRCSVISNRAVTGWLAAVVGRSVLLLRLAGPVRVSATSRGTSTLLQHIAIEYPVAVTIGGATMVIAAGALLGMEESVYPGWPMRLDSMTGDLVIMFPTYAMEWETGGDLRTAFADVPLADYAFDLLGTRPAPRGATDETIRFVIVGQDAQDAWQQYMDMRSKLARIGRGRLWVRDASGNRYWAYVRPMGLATTTFGVENLRHFPVTLTFRRLSDWMARSASSVTLPGNGVHTVRISGNLPVKDLTIDIAATTANGYASPTIENYVTGERLTINRVGSTDRHRLRILTRRWVALESSDGGLTWNDVTPALVVGSLQATVLRLEPTANILSVSGCPGATITISWYDTYA